MPANGRACSQWSTRAPLRFLQLYIFRLGFLDGIPGFQICMHTAYYAFLKQAKLWELHNAIAQPDPEADRATEFESSQSWRSRKRQSRPTSAKPDKSNADERPDYLRSMADLTVANREAGTTRSWLDGAASDLASRLMRRSAVGAITCGRSQRRSSAVKRWFGAAWRARRGRGATASTTSARTMPTCSCWMAGQPWHRAIRSVRHASMSR